MYRASPDNSASVKREKAPRELVYENLPVSRGSSRDAMTEHCRDHAAKVAWLSAGRGLATVNNNHHRSSIVLLSLRFTHLAYKITRGFTTETPLLSIHRTGTLTQSSLGQFHAHDRRYQRRLHHETGDGETKSGLLVIHSCLLSYCGLNITATLSFPFIASIKGSSATAHSL